jgi:hypothetical protein
MPELFTSIQSPPLQHNTILPEQPRSAEVIEHREFSRIRHTFSTSPDASNHRGCPRKSPRLRLTQLEFRHGHLANIRNATPASRQISKCAWTSRFERCLSPEWHVMTLAPQDNREWVLVRQQ